MYVEIINIYIHILKRSFKDILMRTILIQELNQLIKYFIKSNLKYKNIQLKSSSFTISIFHLSIHQPFIFLHSFITNFILLINAIL
jgi:hypothetical protein